MGFRPRFAKSPPATAADGTAPAPIGDDFLAGFGRYAHGRTALQFGIAAAGLRPGDRVLVPEFVCDALVLPLEQAQLVPVYFPVKPSLKPRWHLLEAAITPSVRALVMIHYFGIPQSVDRQRELCRRRNLILIEDNAHGFGGRLAGSLLGTIGDIAISSPWKNFAIRDGGLLHLAGSIDRQFEALPAQPRRYLPTQRQLLRLTQAGWRWNSRRYGHRLQKLAPTRPLPAWRMSDDAAASLRREDLAACAARRRAVHAVWLQWALSVGLEPVIDRPPTEESPLLFAAWCRSPEQRHALLEWMWDRGIEAHTWPKLPASVRASAGMATGFAERMICLPIHQAMAPAALADHLAASGRPVMR